MNKDKRIHELEERIVQLEKDVEELKEERKPVEQPMITPIKKVYKPVAAEKTTLSEPKVKQKKEQTDWETLIGKVWLPRIFIFVLLLGLVWGYRIAVDAGWLNETNRIVIGFIVAGLFYYLGDKQIKKNRIALGKVLLAGFISTLMVTTFAMNVLYFMIPGGAAFVLNIVWVGIGIYLADRHRSETMCTMFAVAGFLIPFLVEGSGNATTVIMVIAYELIFYITLLWFAIRNQYRSLFYVSTAFLHIGYLALIWGSPIDDTWQFLLMSLGILIQHEIIFYTLLKNRLEEIKAFPLLFTNFVFTLLWAKFGFELYDPFNVYHLFTIYVMAATIRYGWVAYQAKAKQHANLFTISTVIATMGVSVLILELVGNERLMVSLYLIQGILAIYLGYRFRSKMQKVMGYIIYYITGYYVITMFMFDIEDLMLWILFIGSLHFLVWFTRNNKDEVYLRHFNLIMAMIAHIMFLFDIYPITHSSTSIPFALQTLAWIAAIFSLYRLYRIAREYMNVIFKRAYIGVNVLIHFSFIEHLTADFGYTSPNTEILLTTLGWALYALGCVYMGMQRQHKPLRLLGVGLILLTLLKLIFVDLAFISLATRSILFVLIGIIGMIVSRFIYGKNK